MRTFRQLIQSPNVAPRWLRNSVLGRYLWSIGLTMDVGTQWLYEGIRQRHPQSADVTTLAWLGRARRVQRGFAESADSYRDRLLSWRSSWRRAGSAWSTLEQIQAYFSPQVPMVRMVTGGTTAAQWWTIDENGEQTFERVTPSNWDWDSADPNTATLDTQRRFHVIVYQDPSDPLSLFPPLGTTADQDPTLTRGTQGLAAAADDLLRLALERKQGGTWCGGIIIAHDLSLWDPAGSGAGYPNGTWYRYSTPVTYLPVRPSGARYFHDRRRPGLFTNGLVEGYEYP